MRFPGLALLLPLAACFSPNPAFVSTTEGDGSDTSTGSPTTTPVTTVVPDTTSGASASATSEPLTSTSEPVTSEPVTSEPTTDTTTDQHDLPGAECPIDKADDQARYVIDVDANNMPITDCDGPSIWIGLLRVANGAFSMVLSDSCDDQGDLSPDLILGEDWPTDAGMDYFCARARVTWKHVGNTCEIGTLQITEYDVNMPDLYTPSLYTASLSVPDEPPDFPFWPTLFIPSIVQCGCDGRIPCCMPDAGQYSLDIGDNQYVEAGAETTFKVADSTYRFKNIQSYVGPGCQDPSGSDYHVDWFAEPQ